MEVTKLHGKVRMGNPISSGRVDSDTLSQRSGKIEDTIIDESEDVEGKVEENIRMEVIKNQLDYLPSRERNIIQMLNGIGLNDEGHEIKPMTKEQVAIFYGVTSARIEQIEAKVLRKLRHPRLSRHLLPFNEGDVNATSKFNDGVSAIASDYLRIYNPDRLKDLLSDVISLDTSQEKLKFLAKGITDKRGMYLINNLKVYYLSPEDLLGKVISNLNQTMRSRDIDLSSFEEKGWIKGMKFEMPKK